MNNKALKFHRYIRQNIDANAFIIKEIDDNLHTTLFYFDILSAPLRLRILFIFDDSQNILLRLNIRENIHQSVIDRDQLGFVLNELNQEYPLFKFYYDEVSQCIALEIMHVAHDDLFDPKILYSQLVWIKNYAVDIYQKVDEIIS